MKNIIGEKFGKLTVIEIDKENTKRQKKFICKCECGNTKSLYKVNLTNGKTLSCGCLFQEKKVKHGLSRTRQYNIWRGMVNRCHKPNTKHYDYYGGRGIEVCKEWREDFMSFYNWSLENGYSEELTIDRKDVNGNYEPSNCRWATMEEQSNNRRNTLHIEHNGEEHTIRELSEKTGETYSVLYSRYKQGYSIEEILNGKDKTEIIRVKELSEQAGVTYSSMYQRVQRGVPEEDLLKSPKELFVENTKRHLIEIDGEQKTLYQLAKEVGISYPSMYGRFKKGLTGKELLAPPRKKGVKFHRTKK